MTNASDKAEGSGVTFRSTAVGAMPRSARRREDREADFLVLLAFATLAGVQLVVTALGAAGLQGFAIIPYLNLMQIVITIGVQLRFIRQSRLPRRWPPIAAAMVGVLLTYGVATVIGLASHNSALHLAAWFFYGTTAFLSFAIQYGLSMETSARPVPVVRPLLVLGFSILGMRILGYALPNGAPVDVPLTFALAVYLSCAPGPAFARIIGLAMILLMCVGHDPEAGWRLEGNRAGFIALFFGGFAYAWIQRSYPALLGMIILPMVLYAVALNLDREFVDRQSRNIREAILLIQGDSIENHLATQQRVYETDQVKADLEHEGPVFYALGLGLGRTIDMTSSLDESVQDASISGANAVNNVHLLPYALLHKFGALGLFAHGFLWLAFFSRLAQLKAGVASNLQNFAAVYLVCMLFYSAFASNFYFTAPFAGICFAVLAFPNGGSRRSLQAREKA